MEVLILIWQLATAFLLLYYLIFYGRFLLYKSPGDEEEVFSESISVIICARNEAGNLRENLPLVLQQEHPHFEVLVVNDRSKDESSSILRQLRKEHPNLRILEIEDGDNYQGKKKALARGIEAAKYDYVVLTDADCQPASEQWLSLMASHFKSKEIVLGFGSYEKQKGWVNKLVQWETLHSAVQYFSMAYSGLPYMGVGRNLAYKKSLFTKSKGFEEHLDLPSGDDDLFISSVARVDNVALEYRKEAFTYSEAPLTLRQWWRQKRRHLSTANRYRFLPKTALALYGTSQLLFYLLLPLALKAGLWALIGARFVLQYVFFLLFSRRFKTDGLWLTYSLWEFLQIIFTALIHLQNTFTGKPRTWK